MRICVIGKYPPIQGGVSMRTYWTAHGLAALGHEVHVVTNAKEVVPPFRMHMRAEDWQRCEASGDAGSVVVHWTDPVDRSQSHIPMASPFVSKLASLTAIAHSARPFDLVYSHYMEPYGIAGHLAAQMAGVPHVVRMAGSDAGRLWHHPQFEALYDHVLRSAAVVVAAGTVADRAIARGVDSRRIAVGSFVVPDDLFTPDGPHLDLSKLKAEIEEGGVDLGDTLWGNIPRGMPHFGIYGKLGDQKGAFALLSAMQRLKRSGLEVGLVALAHGRREIERRFRVRVEELGLADRVLQIPFLPHWRVPEFLRGCLAVCCLEQNFPIGFHAPITPREVLLSGTCLVGSTEVIHKLSRWEQLPHGYGCVAIGNVNNVETLSQRLGAIVRDPTLAPQVGRRGRNFAIELQRRIDFPEALERVLVAASRARRLPSSLRHKSHAASDAVPEPNRFRLTQLIIAELYEAADGKAGHPRKRAARRIDIAQARRTLAEIERAIEQNGKPLQALARAVQVEIAVAHAEDEIDAHSLATGGEPLSRIDIGRWAIANEDLADLVPVRHPGLRILKFDYDVSEFRSAGSVAEFPSGWSSQPSFIAVFGRCDKVPREPVVIDPTTARILELSDGTRTVGEVLLQLGDDARFERVTDGMAWIEELFIRGLTQFRAVREGMLSQHAAAASHNRM